MNLKATIRWVTLAALFIIPFLSLYVANGMFFPFITGKNFAFRILVEVAFAGWALLALVDKRYRPQFSWTFVILIAFVVWMAIADAFAMNAAKAFWSNFERMDGWITLIHLLMFFIAATGVLTADKLWRKWWLAFIAAVTLVCGYGVLQMMHVLAIHQGSTRIDASLGNSAYLAAYMLFAFAITLWLAYETKTEQKWLKYLLYVLAVVEVVVLFATETRGAILGFVGAVMLGALLWMVEAGSRGRKAAAALLVGVLVLIGIFFAIHKELWVQKLPAFGRLASISLSDSETTTRFHIWHMALEGFTERPITGWGQEGFNYVFNKFYDPVLYSQEPWFDRAHDIFFDWLVAGGLPALVLFVGLLGTAIVALYRSKASRMERVLFISAIAAYAFQGIFVFDNLFTYIPLVALLAMAHVVSSRPIAKFESWGEVPEAQLPLFPLPLAVLALALVIWFVNVPGVRAATDLIGGLEPSADVNQNLTAFKKAYADHSFGDQEITEQVISFLTSVVANQQVSTADKQTVATYALQQMQTLVTKIPNDARIRLEYAYGFRSVGDFKDALAQVHVAEQLSPDKQSIYLEEGFEDWQSGNVTAASAAFQKAYQFDTSFSDLAAYAAAGKIGSGDVPGGKALLQQTFGTTTVDQDIVLLGYYTAKDYPDFIAVSQLRAKDQGNTATAEFTLAGAYATIGEYAQARAEVQEAIKEHPETASEGESLLQQINTLAGSSS